MFRNQYDTDVTTWSPAGRLHQVEYAMEAVKQGSAAVGLRSSTHVALATLKRAPSELSSYQKKIFKIDSHIGIAIAGLNADGRVLCRYMRSECINHTFIYESPLPTARLISQVADKSQVCTARSWRRPYGVGLLVAGYDAATGAHLYQTCPSGNYFEFHAMAIGSRSQAAKTYLDRKFETFKDAAREELIRHALFAVKECLQEGELTSKNCSLAIVGKGEDFIILEDEDVQPYIDMLDVDAIAVEGGDDAQKEGLDEEGKQDATVVDEVGSAAPTEGAGAQDGGDGPAPMDDES